MRGNYEGLKPENSNNLSGFKSLLLPLQTRNCSSMKISYNWLRELLSFDKTPEEIAAILTATGLEVENVEEVEAVPGGLKGVVVGSVLTCNQHPNADKLKTTTVDIGIAEKLHIVCGAPNVAAGQKVAVATIGTVLPMGDKPLKIKKGKIRGEVSEGMICAEDELGLGQSHEGIMVLEADAPIGAPLADYLGLRPDFTLEIGLTPNRADAMSHYGVARDLLAALKLQGHDASLHLPSVVGFKVDDKSLNIPVRIENRDACPYYMGITLTNVKVKESPKWLREKLLSIGLTPKNNVVDVTNYILHETGHPLHAFDVSAIAGNKVVIRTAKEGETLLTLDDQERKLHADDLMICNASAPMCIAGVFGGKHSGVTEKTTSVFIESACFNPVSIRKTARRHGLNTDASYRYERGVDPTLTEYALKRAAILLRELAGATISSEIVSDGKPQDEEFPVTLNLKWADRFIGYEIPREKIYQILQSLEIRILAENGDELHLKVPAYRVDVKRPVDVVEEILRIYGFDNIPVSGKFEMSALAQNVKDNEYFRRKAMNLLTGMGFFEMQALSLTKDGYYANLEETFPAKNRVNILNPLSQDLNVMRQSLLFGGLESIARSMSHRQTDLSLFEFGKVYNQTEDGYKEEEVLALWLTGNWNRGNWFEPAREAQYFHLKGVLENLASGLGLSLSQMGGIDNPMLKNGLLLGDGKNEWMRMGTVATGILGDFEIDQTVFYAEIDWKKLVKKAAKTEVKFTPLNKFPIVKRDLALLVDKVVTYSELEKTAFNTERKILKSVSLFDVYEGDKLPEGKKSYAMSFYLYDENKTLTDAQVEKTMQKLQQRFEAECGATLR